MVASLQNSQPCHKSGVAVRTRLGADRMLIQHHSSISPTTSPGALPAHANLGPRPLHVHTTGFSHFHLPLQQPTPASSQPAPSQLQQPLRKPNSCSINRSPNIAHLFANSTSTTCALFSQKSRPDRSAGSAGRRTAKLRESARLLQNRSALARPAKLPSLVQLYRVQLKNVITISE